MLRASDIIPGAIIRSQVHNAAMEVRRVEGRTVLLKDLHTGKLWAVGIDMLRHCTVTVIPSSARKV